MSEAFFSGIKVGDKIWDAYEEDYFKVFELDGSIFKIQDRQGTIISINYNGHIARCNNKGLRRFWWYPIVIEEQVRPKRMVVMERWINIYKSPISIRSIGRCVGNDMFNSEVEAKTARLDNDNYIATTKIKWEEEEEEEK